MATDAQKSFEAFALSCGLSVAYAKPECPEDGYLSADTEREWRKYQALDAVPGSPADSAKVWSDACRESWQDPAKVRAAFEGVAAAVCHDLTPNEHFPSIYQDKLTQCAWNGFGWGWSEALFAAGLTTKPVDARLAMAWIVTDAVPSTPAIERAARAMAKSRDLDWDRLEERHSIRYGAESVKSHWLELAEIALSAGHSR